MSIVRNFNLYLNAGNGSAPYINVNQYDQGEQWVFTLYKEDGTKYLPSTGAIVGIKADNRGIINTGTVDADGRVVINETQQMTAAAGIAIFELLIDGDSHGTANFLVNVEQRPGDNADLSDSDLSLIQQAVDSAEVIVEVIGDSDPSEVIGEHVDAWLDAHPEATTTVEDGAITAPKINQSLWDKLLVSEEASGAVASFDDGADDVPVSSLKVNLEPIQTGSGDPSPSNVRPIIAANGKNKYDATSFVTDTINGITLTNNGDGTFTATGTATATTTFNLPSFTCADGVEYTLNGSPEGGGSSKWKLDLNLSGTYIINYSDNTQPTFTGDGTTCAVRIIVYPGAGNVNITFKPMICLSSITDSSYQPYQGIMVEKTGKNVSQNASATSTSTGRMTINSGTFGTCLANTEYTISFDVLETNTAQVDLRFNDVTPKLTSWNASALVAGNRYSYTFTPTDDGTLNFYSANAAFTASTKVLDNIQVEKGSTASDYEPYTSASYPYTLGQSVYGGTVDLATGVLTVTHGIADENSFTALATGTSGGGLHWAEYTTSDITINGYALSNMVDRKDGGTGWASTTPCFAITDLSRLRVYCAESTLADFKSAYSGLQIIYPLATPQTIQLTPQEVKTLLGYNNISSSGTVDVIYHADTKLYVDKMTAVDNNIIAPTEEGFTATRNYTVNDLIIVNDTLYKVTANIASGSTITPNSNVTQTTLSALIKALS